MSNSVLLLAARELTQDIRVRRQVDAAIAEQLDVRGLCVNGGEAILPLEGVPITRVHTRLGTRVRRTGSGQGRAHTLLRELRGVYRLLRYVDTTRRLVRGARALRSDIVHANELGTLAAATLLARRWQARLVYDAHELHRHVETDPPRLQRALMGALEGLLARRAAAVTTNCDPYAEILERELRLHERPIVVLNAPERLEELPSRPDAGPRLRAVYQAGPDQVTRPVTDVVDAAAAAPNVDISIRVVDFDRGAVERRIAEQGVGDRVRILEPVAATELVSAITEFEAGIVLLRPLTLDATYSQPGKVLEYMMAGLAVVAPDLPGMAPLVADEDVGLVYRNDRPDELGRALEQLAADRGLLERLRSNARAAALSRFNAEAQLPLIARAWGIVP